MKTAITSKGNSLNSSFDLRFGRGAWFCIFDETTQETTFIENENVHAQGGAGTMAGEKMIELGVGKVVSGDFGPKAKDLLAKFNVQMVIMQDEQATISELINKMKA